MRNGYQSAGAISGRTWAWAGGAALVLSVVAARWAWNVGPDTAQAGPPAGRLVPLAAGAQERTRERRIVISIAADDGLKPWLDSLLPRYADEISSGRRGERIVFDVVYAPSLLLSSRMSEGILTPTVALLDSLGAWEGIDTPSTDDLVPLVSASLGVAGSKTGPVILPRPDLSSAGVAGLAWLAGLPEDAGFGGAASWVGTARGEALESALRAVPFAWSAWESATRASGTAGAWTTAPLAARAGRDFSPADGRSLVYSGRVVGGSGDVAAEAGRLLAYLVSSDAQNAARQAGYTSVSSSWGQTPAEVADANTLWRQFKQPASFVVVLDTSPSMERDGSLTAAVRGVDRLGMMLVRGDSIGLITSGEGVTWAASGVRIGQDDLRLRHALMGQVGNGTGMILDCLQAAIDQAAAAKTPTRVVVISDGPDAGSTRTLAEVTESLRKATGVQVFAVAVGPAADRDSLASLAQAGRGEFIEATPDTLADAIERLGARN
jgi:Mg-chelatase subunit ChlD